MSAVDPAFLKSSGLYRLIDCIENYVLEHRAIRAYPEGSLRFLDSLTELAEASKRLLRSSTRVPGWQNDEDRLRNLSILSQNWSTLHGFVKPVTDAHTLRVPLPFLRFLARDLRGLPKMESGAIAFELLGELNYFQRPHVTLRDALSNIANLAEDHQPPELQQPLGIVGLPFSQGSDLFHNCILYHEIGHFVFKYHNMEVDLKTAVYPLLLETFPRLRELDDESEIKEHLAELFKFVRPWCEEVFCDLFAVRMIGPVYTFVMADMLDLIRPLHDPHVHLYSPTHPSIILRFDEQLKLLRGLSWWDELHTAYPELLGLITGISDTPNPGSIYYEEYQGALPDALPAVVGRARPTIRQLASEATAGRGGPAGHFAEQRASIADCLAHAIVPSKALGGNDDDFATLLNAAYLFQVSELSRLFHVTPSVDPKKIDDQAKVRHRVDEWTLKALEYLLYRREQPAVS